MNPKDTIYRQEAIDALETVKPVKAENGELYITKINARMKLEKLPSAQSKQRMRQIGEDTVLFSVPMEGLDATSRVILESGTWCKTFYADEQPRMKGKWIIDPVCSTNSSIEQVYRLLRCNKCDYPVSWPWLTRINFCPNCGADMRGGTG